jgi:hypothetical protein
VPKQLRQIPSFLNVTCSGPGANQVRSKVTTLPDDAHFASIAVAGEVVSAISFNVVAANQGNIEQFWRLIDAFEAVHRRAFQAGRQDVIEHVREVFATPRAVGA